MIDPAVLIRSLGGEWRGHSGNAPCPVCQPERRRDQRGLSVGFSGNKLLMYCHKNGCAFGDIVRAADINGEFEPDPSSLVRARKIQAAEEAKTRDRARRIWDASMPIEGTKGEHYFRSRKITLALPDRLRWRSDLLHTSGRSLSAIVADVQPTGGIHRTYFEKNGVRLRDKAKLMLGPCRGGAVRLARGPGPLLIGEGIESTLSSLQLLNRPRFGAWAALSTSGMKTVLLPSEASELVIAPDGDAPGRDAAFVLANRAHVLGWKVSMMEPVDGLDWNDVLQSGEVAA